MTNKIGTILTAFAGRPGWTMTEIAQYACLPASTAHRLLHELVECGFLQRGADCHYHVGAALHQLAAGSSGAAVDARAQIGQTLEDLEVATGHRAQFGTLRGHGVAYLHLAGGPPHLPAVPAPGVAPTHATAAGKALLAHADQDVLERCIQRGLPRYTSRTIVTVDQLQQALTLVLKNKVAVTLGEWTESHCAIAAPVLQRDGRLLGALELIVPETSNVVRVAGPALVVAARAMARRLAESFSELPPDLGDLPVRSVCDAAPVAPGRGFRHQSGPGVSKAQRVEGLLR